MYKKLLVTIVIVLPMLSVGIIIFGRHNNTKKNSTIQTVDIPHYPSRTPANIPQTVLRFIPNSLQLNEKGEVEAEVFMDAFENNVTSVYIEIGYDPKVFSVVELKATDFLGGKEPAVNAVDKVNGKITYEVKIDLTKTPPLSGSDELLEIVFKPLTATAMTSEISFLPGTTITAQGITGNAAIKTENAHIATSK